MTPKPGRPGEWRPCGDYRTLNAVTTPDAYAMPRVDEIVSALEGATIFTKCDLLKGYFQVPIRDDDIPKTAIATPFGTFLFRYSTFGLRNSGASFQRMMDNIFADVPFCRCYVDDIIIFSRTREDHECHVRRVMELLRENGLVCRPDKCKYGARTIDFLGHAVTPDGVRPSPSKVSAVANFPRPKTIKELQRFLGMINFYRRHLPQAAGTLEPLTRILGRQQARGSNAPITWSEEQDGAFRAAKALLAARTLLAYPIMDGPLLLRTDASDVAIGGVLEQKQGGHPRPLAFFSRILKPAEKRYSVFDRELLALHQSVRHFRHFLEGNAFVALTDHRPLVSSIRKRSDSWTDRQRRQLSELAEYCMTLEYQAGVSNVVADCLSRVQLTAEVHQVQIGVDFLRGGRISN